MLMKNMFAGINSWGSDAVPNISWGKDGNVVIVLCQDNAWSMLGHLRKPCSVSRYWTFYPQSPKKLNPSAKRQGSPYFSEKSGVKGRSEKVRDGKMSAVDWWLACS